jgi:uncharacterized membrane protein YjjB (DUF3815 family)
LELSGIFITSLWAGLFATGLAILLTTPPRHLAATFLCAFSGRLVRDVLMESGARQNWSTVVAAAVVLLVAVTVTQRHRVSPVVVVCGVLPLWVAVAMFNAIFELMKLSTAKGDAINDASVALTANLAKVFVVSLSIALGISAGWTALRLVSRERAIEG